ADKRKNREPTLCVDTREFSARLWRAPFSGKHRCHHILCAQWLRTRRSVPPPPIAFANAPLASLRGAAPLAPYPGDVVVDRFFSAHFPSRSSPRFFRRHYLVQRFSAYRCHGPCASRQSRGRLLFAQRGPVVSPDRTHDDRFIAFDGHALQSNINR